MTSYKSKEHSLTAGRAAVLLCLVQFLGMSLWFTASAVTPFLQQKWGLDAAAAGWLTTVVQLGFVGGTAAAAVLNIADLWPAKWFVAGSCLLAALCNATVATTDSFAVALLMRFLTGFFLAGVYPPGMKMMATWFVQNRGLAIGALVGGVSLGKATPYLLRAIHDVNPAMVILIASLGALTAALLCAAIYHDGPHTFEKRKFDWSLIGTVLKHQPTRLAIGGYLGHMWELYAMWSLVSIYLFEFFMRRGVDTSTATAWSGIGTFATIAAGSIGSVIAGKWADRIGRELTTIYSMAVSGACALIVGHILSSPSWMVKSLVLLWGVAVVADSAQFSALVTEVAPKHAVGTALTLQTSLGFLLTAIAIPLTIITHQRYGWGVAFSILAIGPALGIASMIKLKKLRI